MDLKTLIELTVKYFKLITILIFIYYSAQLLLEYKVEWIKSIRSLATLFITVTFCYLAYACKLDVKDFMLIVSMVFNFYFLVKERTPEEKLIETK